MHIKSFLDEEHYESNKEYYDNLNNNKSYDFWKYRIQALDLSESLMVFDEVQNKGDEFFETYFAGWSFTGMKKEVWLKYPFQCSWNGNGTDAQFAIRYFEANDTNNIYSHKESYFLHLKEEETDDNQYLNRNWLVGEEEPLVHFGEGKLLREEIETEQIYQKKD